ncbi:transcriptional regulator [Vallitalea longa]|uniref:Transcriptional regulator n=1 Tax=Vallitalea longa TaxID=2936439 RepID=A0A9W5YGC3_9FIRM|nr:TetR/AcrR family transcriptional regulator [Vallitalea longa]GKX32151.1 transcriptional regulator [Vallitalea longa]
MDICVENSEINNRKGITRNRIVRVSLDLFIKNGFKDTTMAKIAAKSNISRKTLYEYFKSKEEITTAIDMYVLKEYNRIMEKTIPSFTGNGYNKLCQYFEMIDRNIDEFQNEIIFTGIYDYNVKTNDINSSLKTEFYRIVKKATSYLVIILEQGIEDGSLKDCDPTITANTIGDSWLSLARRVFKRNESLDMNEQDCRKMISVQLSLFLKGLKA